MKSVLACMLGLALAAPSARAQSLDSLAAIAGGGEVSDATAAAVARRFAAELKCGPQSRDPQRGWCPIAGLDKAGFAAPPQTQVLLGLSVELAEGARVAAALRDHVRPGVLILSRSAARVIDLRPSKGNKEEEKELAGVVFELGRILKGAEKGAAVPVSRALAGFLLGEGQKPGRPLSVGAGGAHFTGVNPSRLHRVQGLPYGDAYVAIEQAPNGLFVSIFPVVPFRPR